MLESRDNLTELNIGIVNAAGRHEREGSDGSSERERDMKHRIQHRKNQSAACCFCKKRRKKCDGGFPSCSACVNANITCTFIDKITGRELPRNYVQLLESRIRELERNSARNGGAKESIEGESAGKEEKVLEQFIKYSIPEVSPDERYKISIIEKPEGRHALKLLKVYEEEIQCQYPFLDWPWVKACFDKVFKLESKEDEPNLFVFLILAVANELLVSEQREEGDSASSNNFASWRTKEFYGFAVSLISNTIRASNLRTIQVYLLLGMYYKFSCKGVERNNILWNISGVALRNAIVLNLHRKPVSPRVHNHGVEEHVLQDLRSRVFWSAYSLERINGLILCRPFCISDVDIDALLPESNEYSLAIHIFKLRRIQSSICTFVYGPRKFLDNEDEVSQSRQQIMLELQEWRFSFTPRGGGRLFWGTQYWCDLMYHQSVVWLLRPILQQIGNASNENYQELVGWWHVFINSAVAICMGFKEFENLGKIDYSLLSIQSLFVAGVTFLYSVWLDLNLNIIKWDNNSSTMKVISHCSIAFESISKRRPDSDSWRLNFQKISLAIVKRLQKYRKSDDYVELCKSLEASILAGSKIQKDDEARHTMFSKVQNSPSIQDPVNFSSRNNLISISQSSVETADESFWKFLNETGDTLLLDIVCDMLEESE